MAERKRGTVRDLRRDNRSVLLRALYFGDPRSRQELSAETGLSPASVSNVVRDLMNEGIAVEVGSVDSDGGRPRVLLRVNPAYGHVIGVDVGETRVQIELFDLAMAERAKADYPLDRGHDPGEVVTRILEGIDAVLADGGADPASVLGVGIGVPGVVRQRPEVIVDAQTFGWSSVPLERLLREGLPDGPTGTPLPLLIDNGANTMGRAELWFGSGRGARNAIIGLIGSGVGSAVIRDGSPDNGADASAGEWGHTPLIVDGRRCRCGNVGCLEAYVGAEAMLERYVEAGGDPLPGDQETALARLVLDAATPGTTAARLVDETVAFLGASIGGLINLLAPERIILGGWAGLLLGDRYLAELRAAASRHSLRHLYASTSIELCRLGPDAVALGAATLPLDRFLDG
ncbi:ROK family transcriptional regulator [Actinocorallia sp. A-T 12471]|uniref:ROK family transcriptional regulator n=1 Tax=Actinocorallia sp. A-T 12471 TaxID=3089813 RepID=UPI0029D3948D|nr:ROK family transcriptional regulator [Actinocorallia sp. A-T 12471]MDX6740505.1 ROK family transcriptional regulator [Actinocorallia sp. A-T 12471]